MLVPLPQVGFLNKDSEYEFFLIDNIPSKDVLESKGFELEHPNGILILPLSAQEEARTRLKERGIDMKVKEGTGFQPSQNEDLLCEVEGTTDQTILRAVAKICFNYLAYWEKAEFVLHEGFNLIRRYIREGETTNYQLVNILDRPILADEQGQTKRRLGHIITVNWANDGVSIISQVSLLNWITYSVCLAKDFSGEHRNIARGHFFNPTNKEISELQVN